MSFTNVGALTQYDGMDEGALRLLWGALGARQGGLGASAAGSVPAMRRALKEHLKSVIKQLSGAQ